GRGDRRVNVRVETNGAVALKPCDIQCQVRRTVVIEGATRMRFVRNPKSNPPPTLVAEWLDFPSVPRAGQMHETAETSFMKLNVEVSDVLLAEIQILVK